MFLLGCGVIIDALVDNRPLGHLIVGLVMVGVLPLDDLVAIVRHGHRNTDERPQP